MNVVLNILASLAHGIPGLVVGGLSIIFIMLGLIRKDAGMVLIAAILTIPITYLSGGWTGLLLLVRLLPLFVFVSAYLVNIDEMILGWVFPAPAFGYIIYILFNILVSDFRGV